jgi:hypothetical protein
MVHYFRLPDLGREKDYFSGNGVGTFYGEKKNGIGDSLG